MRSIASASFETDISTLETVRHLAHFTGGRKAFTDGLLTEEL